MSVYFQVGNREIWNPASRVGVLFCGQALALEALAGQTTGIADLGCDEYDIEPDVFVGFVDAVLVALSTTNHAVLLALRTSWPWPWAGWH